MSSTATRQADGHTAGTPSGGTAGFIQTEHEISAFGAVRAEQIEGILVVRKPAAVP